MKRDRSKIQLTVVSPVYNEGAGVEKFVEEVGRTLSEAKVKSWKILLVNDGSRDDSLERMRTLSRERENVQYLSLSRNFGHQAALTAGLHRAKGDVVVMIDSDLQDPPELILDFLTEWENGKDVVFGRRSDRSETGLRRIGFDLFHRFFHYCIDFALPSNVGIFGLLDRRAVEELKGLNERNRFLPGLQAWVGFERGFVDYKREDREFGAPKQSFKALRKYAIDAVLSFSYKPVRLLRGFGLFVAMGAFALAAFFTIKRLLGYEVAFTGFTTLVILICFFGGLQLMALGLLGEYLVRIYDEVKGRPLYIVAESSISEE